jgi:DNA-directed RNA polymerase specialized sigma24 family protein
LFSSRRNLTEAQRGDEYATPCDLARIFHHRADQLYTLSSLLTADRDKAEQCFIAGLEDCLEGNPVFREWAESWARRIVIKNAIRMVSPKPGETRSEARSDNCEPPEPVPAVSTLVGAITQLAPFERFVYVMSVLEGYSGRDCSTLLRCTPNEIVKARTRALQRLANILNREPVSFASLHGGSLTSSGD